MLPPTIRTICWLPHSTIANECDDQNDHLQTELSALSLGTCSEVHKLAAWTAPPCQNTQYYYLTFNAPSQAPPQDHGPKLTTDFSFSSNVEFCTPTN